MNFSNTGTVVEQVDLRAVARELYEAGICAVPVSEDGSKTPDLRSWTPYKATPSTPDEHDTWFDPTRRASPRTGIGVVYGAVSGNLELIEFEGRAIVEGLLEKATEIFEASGLGDLWHAITTGWVDVSPSGGKHFRIRVTGTPVKGNTKLANRLARDEELTDEERQRLVQYPKSKILRGLSETRGEGGFGIIAPSHGTVHPSGLPYVREAGGPGSEPVLDAEFYSAVHTILQMLDEVPQADTAKTAPRDVRPLPGGRLRPGEDYEAKVDWADILLPLGWTFVFQHGPTRYWRRPGKTQGLSATTGHASDRDRLYVFTTSTEFISEMPYTKFGAYGHIHHNGDFKAASQALQEQGYGDKAPHRGLASVTTLPTRGATGRIVGATALQDEPAPDYDPADDRLPDRRGQPEVNITNEADAIDGLLEAMEQDALPDLFKRAGGPVWVDQDDQGNPVLHQLTSDNLRAYFDENVQTFMVAKDEETGGTKAVRALVQSRTCATILGRKDWPLPRIRGIVTSPVVRPDGSLLTEPGYDPATGLYLHPRVPLRRLQSEVTPEQVEKAKKIVLDEMLADFPWQQPSDKAHYLGALLTPILRPYFPGTTPMFIITATAMGSGKTLLKDVLTYCYGTSETQWPENDAELRKAITTQLYTTGQPVVVLDNLPNGHIIKSPVLSSLMTAEFWGDRVLGSNASVNMPNDRLWMLTGNSLRTGGDNGRRAMWVRLDPDCPDPDQRDGFTAGDLRPWLRRQAGTVVAALVTMVRGWLAEGAKPVRVRKGDYSEWASMIAGVLTFLGVPGWLADRDNEISMDDETQEWSAFLTVWRNKLGSVPVTTGMVLGSVADHAPRMAKTGELPSANVLGGWLKARQGRYFGNHKVVLVWDAHKCQNTWRVDVHEPSGYLPGVAQ